MNPMVMFAANIATIIATGFNVWYLFRRSDRRRIIELKMRVLELEAQREVLSRANDHLQECLRHTTDQYVLSLQAWNQLR